MMGRCLICGDEAVAVSSGLGVCLKCIREGSEGALEVTRQVHAKSRAVFGLPAEQPLSLIHI